MSRSQKFLDEALFQLLIHVLPGRWGCSLYIAELDYDGTDNVGLENDGLEVGGLDIGASARTLFWHSLTF